MNLPAAEPRPLKIIGLTGLYCAGKNHIAALLEKRGIPVLDVDKLGHRALEMEKTAIVNEFGKDTLTPDGAVDRGILGKKVFGSAECLARLESIVHPAANRLTGEWIVQQAEAAVSAEAAGPFQPENAGGGSRGFRLCIINAALLHRSSIFHQLDAIIVVKASFLTRLIRAKKRDALPLGELVKRFTRQAGFTSQYFQGNADMYSIGNPGFSGRTPRFDRKLEKRLDEILNTLGRI